MLSSKDEPIAEDPFPVVIKKRIHFSPTRCLDSEYLFLFHPPFIRTNSFITGVGARMRKVVGRHLSIIALVTCPEDEDKATEELEPTKTRCHTHLNRMEARLARKVEGSLAPCGTQIQTSAR